MSTDAGDSGVGAAGAHTPAAGTPPADTSAADASAAGTSAADASGADASGADASAAGKPDLLKPDTGAKSAVTTGSSGRGLKVHHLRPAPGAHRDKMRVGRGQGSKGKTSGRGTKGSKARKQIPARFEGGQMPLHMRVPKLKGFTNHFRVEYQVVNLARLGELFPAGGRVGPDELVATGAVRAGRPVKVLGDGELATAVEVSAHAFSASAREKIVTAGGSTTVI